MERFILLLLFFNSREKYIDYNERFIFGGIYYEKRNQKTNGSGT